jgi:hypothetical protein
MKSGQNGRTGQNGHLTGETPMPHTTYVHDEPIFKQARAAHLPRAEKYRKLLLEVADNIKPWLKQHESHRKTA